MKVNYNVHLNEKKNGVLSKVEAKTFVFEILQNFLGWKVIRLQEISFSLKRKMYFVDITFGRLINAYHMPVIVLDA